MSEIGKEDLEPAPESIPENIPQNPEAKEKTMYYVVQVWGPPYTPKDKGEIDIVVAQSESLLEACQIAKNRPYPEPYAFGVEGEIARGFKCHRVYKNGRTWETAERIYIGSDISDIVAGRKSHKSSE